MVTKNAFENAFFNLMNNAVFRKKQKKIIWCQNQTIIQQESFKSC